MAITEKDFSQIVKALQFAAEKHKNQRRKGISLSPYINHPIEVVRILVEVGQVHDPNILVAATLHDTLEDTETTSQELTDHFGDTICSLVEEVTDDKSLSKEERKRQQILYATSKSPAAKQIKVADKIANINDLIKDPPDGWSPERKRAYINWAIDVFQGLKGVNQYLDHAFQMCVVQADAVL
jgi:guanosine-3',5'-bis(diphosphate) 3'-pyrophosphohydrolase